MRTRGRLRAVRGWLPIALARAAPGGTDVSRLPGEPERLANRGSGIIPASHGDLGVSA